MQIPNEARLTEDEIDGIVADEYMWSPDDASMMEEFQSVAEAQLAKAAPIIEALAKKEERERLIKKLEAGEATVNCSCGCWEALKEGSEEAWRK